MYAEERQAFMTAQLRAEGRVDATQLAAALQVTGETVRRDLIALERQGVLRRTHGGAILVQRLGFEPVTEVRAAAMVEEKRRIASAALKELPDEGAILLDAGTTTALMAEFLPADRKLLVVTNSLLVVNTLIGRPHITLMSVGGRMRQESVCSVDSWALRALADIRVDVAFVGTNGLTVEHGLTTSDQAEAAVKAQMISSGRRVVVLADHSKIGTEYFHRFATLDDIDVLITDDGIDSDLENDLKAKGPHVMTV